MKAFGQFFEVVNKTQKIMSVGETHGFDYLGESYWASLSCCNIYCATQGLNFKAVVKTVEYSF